MHCDLWSWFHKDLPVVYFGRRQHTVLFHLVSLRNIPPRQDNRAWLMCYQWDNMSKDLESSVLAASPVVVLRRIELLVLVLTVMGGVRTLPVYRSTSYLFPILAVKHSSRGKEERAPIAYQAQWECFYLLVSFILVTSLRKRYCRHHFRDTQTVTLSSLRSPR